METLSIIGDASHKVVIKKFWLYKKMRIKKWSFYYYTALTIGKHSINLVKVIIYDYKQARLIIKEKGGLSQRLKNTIKRRLGVLDSPMAKNHKNHTISV